jgi:hypothetical protein
MRKKAASEPKGMIGMGTKEKGRRFAFESFGFDCRIRGFCQSSNLKPRVKQSHIKSHRSLQQ